MSLTRIAPALLDWLQGTGAPLLLIVAGVVLLYLVLGMLLDSIGILVLTLPFTVPLMEGYGFDLIWFGVVVVKLLEIRSDHAADRAQRLCHQVGGAARCHLGSGLSRRRLVPDSRLRRAAGDPGDPRHLAIDPAQRGMRLRYSASSGVCGVVPDTRMPPRGWPVRIGP